MSCTHNVFRLEQLITKRGMEYGTVLVFLGGVGIYIYYHMPIYPFIGTCFWEKHADRSWLMLKASGERLRTARSASFSKKNNKKTRANVKRIYRHVVRKGLGEKCAKRCY